MEELLSSFLTSHPVLAPLLFVLLRAVPVVVAPIPGVLFDLVGLAVFGWRWGLLLALIGGHLGASIAFFIGRYFREPAVRYFVPLQRLHDMESRYSERQKFWTLVAVRFVTSPFFDYVNYAAGLTKMPFGTFLLSTFIGVLPISFVIYYFGGIIFNWGIIYAGLFFIGLGLLSATFGKALLKKF